jgi:hypothetical protein
VTGVAGPGGINYATVPTNAIAQTFPRSTKAVAAAATLTSGTLYLYAIELPIHTVITSLTFSAGPGLSAATHQWFALYSKTLVRLRQTADVTSAAWA